MAAVKVSVSLDLATLARLDRFAGDRNLSRSEAVRVLVNGEAGTAAPAEREEALALLTESARAGSVAARVALARLLARDVTDPIQRRRDELAQRRRARRASP